MVNRQLPSDLTCLLDIHQLNSSLFMTPALTPSPSNWMTCLRFQARTLFQWDKDRFSSGERDCTQ